MPRNSNSDWEVIKLEKGFTILARLMRKTAIPFMIAVMFLNIIGYLSKDQLVEFSVLFHERGVTYGSIFQLCFLSLLIGGINTIFDSPAFMKKTLMLYKDIFRILIIVVLSIGYIWYNAWFPAGNIEAWISFLITFGICTGLSIAISLYLTHKKNLEYQELLKKYKERGHSDECNQYSKDQ